jgi:CBS domain-containing protein
MKVRDIMHAEVKSIGEDDDVTLAQQLMLWNGIHHLPVLRSKRLVGIVNERDIVGASLGAGGLGKPQTKRIADIMETDVQLTQPNADVADAAGIMSVHRTDALPVVEAGKLVGILTITDVLAVNARYALPEPSATERRVEDVMTAKVAAAREDDRLLDAVATMIQRGARHLPVINALEQVVGMLSDRDVRTAIGDPTRALEERSPSARVDALHVKDVMTRDPRSLDTGAPLSEAVGALIDDRFGALPVVDEEERLRGMVSYVDLLRLLSTASAPREAGLHSHGASQHG